MRLATIGKKIGIKALREVAMIVKPETILTWYRKLIAAKFDSSKKREKKVGRPLTDCELEALILQISKRNPRWGYDRIAGALANLGYHISDQTVGNILKRNGIMPAPPPKPLKDAYFSYPPERGGVRAEPSNGSITQLIIYCYYRIIQALIYAPKP